MATPTIIRVIAGEAVVIGGTAENSKVIAANQPVSTVIVSAGASRPYFRDIINYDGGFPDTLYGGLTSLDGGGVSDGSRYSI